MNFKDILKLLFYLTSTEVCRNNTWMGITWFYLKYLGKASKRAVINDFSDSCIKEIGF